MLEAHPIDRICVPACGLSVCADDQTAGVQSVLKARGAAVIMSAKDYGNQKEELDLACRDLGKDCTAAHAEMVKGMQRVLDAIKRSMRHAD